MTGRRQPDRGQATVELVLVLPFVLLLLLAVVQVGLVTRDRLLLAHVAREAARAAAVQPEPVVATTAARQASGLEPDRLSVDLDGGRSTGDRLRVTVSYQAPTAVPVVGPLLGDLDLESSVTIRVE